MNTLTKNSQLAIAQEVAKELNASKVGGFTDWSAFQKMSGDGAPMWIRLVANGTVELTLQTTWNQKTHLTIGASFDRVEATILQKSYTPSDRPDSISVKADRPAKQIASEIVRRLWGAYEPALARAVKTRNEHLTEIKTREAFRELVGKVGMVKAIVPYQNRDVDQINKYTFGSYGDGGVRGDVDVSYDARVKITVDELTHDQAVRVLQLLAKMKAGK